MNASIFNSLFKCSYALQVDCNFVVDNGTMHYRGSFISFCLHRSFRTKRRRKRKLEWYYYGIYLVVEKSISLSLSMILHSCLSRSVCFFFFLCLIRHIEIERECVSKRQRERRVLECDNLTFELKEFSISKSLLITCSLSRS